MLIYYLITTVHVLVCIILCLVVLLQSGKGADIAGAFGGGGSQTAFGSRGPASFLSKMTTVAAIVFMLTCLGLSMITTRREATSVMDTAKGAPAPASKAPAPTKSASPAPTQEQIQQQVKEIEERMRQQQAQPAAPQAKPGATAAPASNAPAQQPQSKPAAAKETKPPAEKKP